MEKISAESNNLNYEAALELKNDLDYIELLNKKQKVEILDLVNRDVINYYINNGYISINIFFLRGGKLLGNKNKIYPITDDYLSEIEMFIVQFYLKNEIPKEIIIPEDLNKDLLSNIIGTRINYAYKGKKKKLLDMVKTNAKISLDNKFESIKRDEKRTIIAQESLKEILKLDKLYRIDVFDNSNLFGSFTVSAMVVFKDGKPSKSDYRKFKISIDKNDDYNTMKEVMYRRYQKMLVKKEEKPDLIIVDGGTNQINATKEIMNLLNLNIKVVGLKKNDKHRTNELIDENLNTIDIDKTSDVFHLLTRMQDEVHRYTITYHKDIRSKGALTSILDNIDGIGETRKKIGEVRKKDLLKRFKSLNKIKDSSIEELKEVLPEDIAKNLKTYLEEYFNR